MANPLGPSAFGAARATSARPSVPPNNSGPDTWFGDCSSPTSRDGTELRAAFLNAVLAQFREMIRAGGAPEDNSDEMLLRAIRSQRVNFAAAAAVGGSANAVSLAFDPPFSSLSDLVGVPLRFLVESNSTAAVTVSVDGLAATALHYVSGEPISSGGLVAGRLIEIVYDGSRFVALAGATAASGHTHPMSDVVGLLAALDNKITKTGDSVLGDLIFNNLIAIRMRSVGGAFSETAGFQIFKAGDGSALIDNFDGDLIFRRQGYGSNLVLKQNGTIDVTNDAVMRGNIVGPNAASARTISSDPAATGAQGGFIQTYGSAHPVHARKVMIGNSDVPRLTVDGSGRVGIGTTAPDQALVVLGNISTSGGIQVSGSLGTADRVMTGGSVAQWRTMAELGFAARVVGSASGSINKDASPVTISAVGGTLSRLADSGVDTVIRFTFTTARATALYDAHCVTNSGTVAPILAATNSYVDFNIGPDADNGGPNPQRVAITIYEAI